MVLGETFDGIDVDAIATSRRNTTVGKFDNHIDGCRVEIEDRDLVWIIEVEDAYGHVLASRRDQTADQSHDVVYPAAVSLNRSDFLGEVMETH